MKKTHYPPLDGLRGLAVLLVVLVHAYHYRGPSPIGKAVNALAGAGWTGVTLFFVLSGFLISGILLDTRGRNHYLRDFFARRSLRIFPLYFAFLAFYFLVVPQVGFLAHRLPQPRPESRVYYLTYTTNMREWLGNATEEVPPLGPLWSLAVEEQVYLFWPFLVLLIPRRAFTPVFLSLAVGSFSWRLLTLLTHQPIPLTYSWTPANLEAFCAGALVALYSREHPLILRAWAPRVALASGSFLLGMLLSQHHFNFWRGPVEILTVGSTAVVLFFASTIAISVSTPEQSRFNRLLSMAWLRRVGKFSYAMYLFHFTVLALLAPSFFSSSTGYVRQQSVLDGVLFTSSVAVASFLAASVSWYAWERHFLRLKAFFPLSGNVVHRPPCPPLTTRTRPDRPRSRTRLRTPEAPAPTIPPARPRRSEPPSPQGLPAHAPDVPS